MFSRLSAFVIWSLVSATAVFWILRLSAHAPQVPAHAVAIDRAAPVRGSLTRLFGAPSVVAAAPEAQPEAASRFRLLGVMAPKSTLREGTGGDGLALIAIDGKPAKAYAVGSRLESDMVLKSVGMRTASLGPATGERSMLLELPMLAAPATGVLPTPGSPATMTSAMPAAPLRPTAGPVPAAAPVPAAPVNASPGSMSGTVPATPGSPSADSFRAQ